MEKRTKNAPINWHVLKNLAEIEAVLEESKQMDVVIFKHSPSCFISKKALKNFELGWELQKNTSDVSFYFIDVLKSRPLSQAIAKTFNVIHQSPQLLHIRDENVIQHSSHGSIEASVISD